jgi:hypothetical protein
MDNKFYWKLNPPYGPEYYQYLYGLIIHCSEFDRQVAAFRFKDGETKEHMIAVTEYYYKDEIAADEIDMSDMFDAILAELMESRRRKTGTQWRQLEDDDEWRF